MSNRGDTTKLNWPRWQQALLIALLVLIIGNRMTMLVDTVAVRAGIVGELAWGGVTFVPDPQAKPGFARVTEVVPGSPAARAGVMVGDYLTSERRYEYYRRPNVGERFDFTLERQGVRHDPAPVDRGRNRRGVDIGSRGDLCQHQPLARVIGEAVTGARPTARATECKETSVLA